MNLAFAVFKYFPFGGMQKNMLAIAKECAQRGHQVVIYTGEWQGEIVPELDVKILPVKGISNHQRNRSFSEALQKTIQREHVDLVVGFNKMPGLDVYYAGDSCFAAKAYEDRSFLYRMTGRCKMSLAFERAVFAKESISNILLVSRAERAAYVKYYQTQDDRIFPLPPGISRQCIMSSDAQAIRESIRRDLDVAEDEHVFLALGSGFRTKGLDRSIQMLAALPASLKTRLIVVGQDKNSAFVSLAKKLGVDIKVCFLGGRGDVPALLQGADVLLHPAYRENTGNVLLEAMIAGLPVVVTDVCGYAHYVESAKMGHVLPSPFCLSEYTSVVQKILQVSRDEWQGIGKLFADNADIYHRPKRAAELIETIAGYRND